MPKAPAPNLKTQDVLYMCIDKEEVCIVYTDLNDRFPRKSSSGNEYILVAYHYDAHYILGTALKNRKKDTITTGWTYLHKSFIRAGVAPNTYVMNNEISQEFIETMVHNNTTYQLVPPHTHRRNLA